MKVTKFNLVFGFHFLKTPCEHLHELNDVDLLSELILESRVALLVGILLGVGELRVGDWRLADGKSLR